MFCLTNNFLLEDNRVIKGLSFLVIVIILSSCVSRTETYQGFFQMDSLVTDQNERLRMLKASVKKVARLNEQNQEVNLPTLDSLDWENELNVFRELESINKPNYKNSYTVEDELPDSKSNLKVMAISFKKNLPEKDIPPVKYFRVFYQDSHDNLRKIEAQLDETNALYKSSRMLTLEFQDIHNKVLLTSYSIEGGQKMFLGDTVAYAIKGVVSVAN